MYKSSLVSRLVTFALVATLALSVFANIGTVQAQQDKPVLNVYNWTTYIAENTISDFEEKYNVKVVYDTYASADELYAKMLAGNPGYDIIFPPDYVVEQLITADLLEEIDLNNLPTYQANVDPTFTSPPYDPDNKHCVVYQWGTTGIGYNVKSVGKEITGWKDAFALGLKGRVGLINSARDTLGVGLFALGLDPNTTNIDDLTKAKDYLLQYKDQIATFHDEDGQAQLLRGDLDIVMEYSGDIFQVMEENEDIHYVIPEEGTIIWTDNMCIPKGGQNKELAEKFIDYIYDAQVSADIANFTYYGSPNKAAIDEGLIDAEALENPGIYPSEEVRKKLVFLVDVGDAMALYDEVFADLKASVSQ